MKIEQVRTWLLSSSLAEFEQLQSECFFQFCFRSSLPGYMFHVQFLPWGLVVLLFCYPYDDWSFWLFGLKNSNCSPLKIVFSEGPSFFVRSVCNHGALNLCLHVVALPASLAMSWPAEITQKLNRSGLENLVLVLQSSNSFLLNAFFNFASVKFFLSTWFMFKCCPWGLVDHLFCSPYDDWRFWLFGLKIWNYSLLKIIFSEGPSFLYVLFFVIMGLWNCACAWQPCQCRWPCHDQPSLHKSWTGQVLTS